VESVVGVIFELLFAPAPPPISTPFNRSRVEFHDASSFKRHNQFRYWFPIDIALPSVYPPEIVVVVKLHESPPFQPSLDSLVVGVYKYSIAFLSPAQVEQEKHSFPMNHSVSFRRVENQFPDMNGTEISNGKETETAPNYTPQRCDFFVDHSVILCHGPLGGARQNRARQHLDISWRAGNLERKPVGFVFRIVSWFR
jgi:hypothetical protein